jgi:pimeloyl-ACP methyl ester carboxylesterase
MPIPKIAHREVGEGPILVLVHGYAGSVLHWNAVVEKLKGRFKLVIPNFTHLFMGTEQLSFSEQVDMFANFLKTHYSERKVNLAGISYGGAIVWGVSLKYPELVDRTVFINPMPPDPVGAFQILALKVFFRLPLSPRSIYFILRTPIGRFFLKRAAQVFRLERADHWDRFENLDGRKLLFVCHVLNNFAMILKTENWSTWKLRLKNWNHLSLLIYDYEDPLFEPRTYLRFQELIGCDRATEIHQAGHIAIQTRADEISEMMIEFLNVERSTTAA